MREWRLRTALSGDRRRADTGSSPHPPFRSIENLQPVAIAQMQTRRMMNSFIVITGQRVAAPTRKCWMRRDGSLATVEEIVGEHYLVERGFDHYLTDTSCVYGGLLWVLFSDLLFHTNVAARNPLRRLFYYQPGNGYARYRDGIEERLSAFAAERVSCLRESYIRFYAHPLFADAQSQVSGHFGAWARYHEEALITFCRTAPEHGMEDLIRECLLTSSRGVNRGWPDLVIWRTDRLVFTEVKARDKLSAAQTDWIQQHCDVHAVELVRVMEAC